MAKLLTLLFWPKKLKINISKSSKKPYFYSVFDQQAKNKKTAKKSNNFGTCNHNLSCKKYPEVLPLFWGCFFLVSVFLALPNLTTWQHKNTTTRTKKTQKSTKTKISIRTTKTRIRVTATKTMAQTKWKKNNNKKKRRKKIRNKGRKKGKKKEQEKEKGKKGKKEWKKRKGKRRKRKERKKKEKSWER